MLFVIIIFFYVFLSWLVAYTGRYRTFGFWGYFFASLLLSPFLGLLFVIASGGNNRYIVAVTRDELEAIESTRVVAVAKDEPGVNP